MTAAGSLSRGIAYLATCSLSATAISQDASNWTGFGRTADELHFSPLTQISQSNVAKLGLVWSLDLPTMLSSMGAPVEADGVLYAPVGLSVVYAIDAASGATRWIYDPHVAQVAGYKLQEGWGIRGIAYNAGRLYLGTQDGRLIALNATSGKPIWITNTTELNDGLYITGAPRVFRGKVIIGNGGSDFANVRGYVTAYDELTGRKLWRFYTVPGDPAKGFENPAMAMAAKTWTGEWWKFGGGGTPWNAITFDETLNRIYVGSGGGGPWNYKIRSPAGGDNLFLASIVALDADTGGYIWHYQENPGETWDWDSAEDIELTTLKLGGVERRVILQAPKNGFFYVIDRDSGKLISAAPISKVTWASGIDPNTGRPIENAEARFLDKPALVYPGTQGVHGPEPMAYNPGTGLVYIPTDSLPGFFADDDVDLKHWTRTPGIVTGIKPFELPNLDDADNTPLGSLQAWDPVRNTQAWSVPLLGAINGGVLTTAGDLVFQGQADGKFVARAAQTGASLWSFDAQNGIKAQPISYSVAGKQYITVVTGFGGPPTAFGPLAAQFKWDYRSQKRRILTFALDGIQKLPLRDPSHTNAILDDPSLVINPAKAKAGHLLYYHNCMTCHGIEAIAGGGAPDLRMSHVPLSAAAFAAVVQQGALLDKSMPKFDTLSAADLEAIRTYIRNQARRSPKS
jgi:quinohemoprotein ethanol dehydrogenase